MKNPLFFICCLWTPFTMSCLFTKDVFSIDLESGKAAQRELVASLFSGRDIGIPPPGWPPSAENMPPTVSAAWWGFHPGDSTAGLQRALDSGAATVFVPRMEAPWRCEELFIRSGTRLILEEGAVLLAKEGAFRGRTQSFLNIIDVKDVAVLGYGAFIRMHRADYSRPPYEKAEWRHAIRICGASRITIAGLTAEFSGGDGVYLGRGSVRIANNDILLKDLLLRNHYRQGVSVISVRGLTMENVEMSGTSGTPPGAGIDFEPNLPDEPIANCTLRHCRLSNNSGAGFQCYFINHDAESEPFDITLEDCLIFGNLAGAIGFGFENGARGRIVFRKTRVFGFSLMPRLPGRVDFFQE